MYAFVMTTERISLGGLRERKRIQTLERITEVALEQFVEHGYEATTLDAIAEAANIARRTFFHYFASKEDILLAWQDALPPRFRAALLEQSTDQSPAEAMRLAHLSLATHYDADQAQLIASIIASSVRLRAANQAKFIALEELGFETLCEMWPSSERRDALRLVAMTSVGALRIAIAQWVSGTGSGALGDHINAAFATMTTELSVA